MELKKLTTPYISEDYQGIGGKIKITPEDFIVEEIPAYYPSGSGEHLFIHLTKKGITTKEVQKVIANIFNTKVKDVEFAGIKDKHAVTSQYFSVWLLDKQDPELVHKLEEELPVKINSYNFHQRKIKKGHLWGNIFNIKIRDIEADIDEAFRKTQQITKIIHQQGLPNLYGNQRFGIEGDNAQQGLEILKGQRKVPNKWLRQFLLSSFQSHLFNYYIVKRIEAGLLDTLMQGDLAKKHDTGGMFVVEDKATEQERFDNKEICFTGPMFGKKMTPAKEEALEFEKSIMEENGVSTEEFKQVKVNGTRRTGIILPEIESYKEDDGIRIKFNLPKGAFATIVLREIMKNE